ncbi:protein of unknown function [Burkholderia multivorans]
MGTRNPGATDATNSFGAGTALDRCVAFAALRHVLPHRRAKLQVKSQERLPKPRCTDYHQACP